MALKGGGASTARAVSPSVRTKRVALSTACREPAPSWAFSRVWSRSQRFRARSCTLRVIAGVPDQIFFSHPQSPAIQHLPHSPQQHLRGKRLRQTFFLIAFSQSHLLRISGAQ